MIKTSIIDPELALKIVLTSKVMCYDTETSGLQAGVDFIVGHVITDFEASVYVPVRHTGGGNIPQGDAFERELAAAFAERARLGYRTVGHHLGFDLRMALWNEPPIILGGPLEDTMVNESLIDDRTVGYGLEDLSTRHRVTVKKGAALYAAIAARFGGLPDRTSMQHFHKMEGDHPEVLDYTTGDGVSTLEVWQSQQPILDEEDLRKPWKLECDLLPYVARVHRRGLRVNAEYADKVGPAIKAQIDKQMEQFAPGFNVRSPKDVEDLYRANGFGDADFVRTAPSAAKPNGQVSFTEKWLETNEIGDAILGVRRLEKARDSFIKPLTTTHNIRGRVHPVLHQSKSDEYGVAGARFSCSDPNMQAFPKRNMVVGKVVRELVCADDGLLLEEGDAMQQEPRLFTHYSQDPVLLEGYRNGTMDIHDRCNQMLFSGDKADRDTAKRMAMGMLTMMQPKTLAVHMRWDVARATEAHHAFLTNAFPLINEFQQEVIRRFRTNGFVYSILGRKARMEGPAWSAYKGVSRVIQNSAGDHLKTCFLRACQYEDAHPEIQVLMSIHDSMLWQRDPGVDVKPFVAVMENVPHEPDFDLSVPIPFEVGSGKHWAESSYGDKIKGKKGWLI